MGGGGEAARCVGDGLCLVLLRDEWTCCEEVSLLGSGDGPRWGARGKIFGEDRGGGRHGEERWRDLGEGEVVEQYGERERPELGEGERVERSELEEFDVDGGERLRAGGGVEVASQLGDHRGDALNFVEGDVVDVVAKTASSPSLPWRRRRR